MTNFKKILLAGTASFALLATPVLAADVLGGASGTVSGATSGAVGATGDVGGKTLGGSAGAATGTDINAGTGGASVGSGASAEGAAEGTGLSTGAKGGVSVTGEAEAPSADEIENSVEGAAAASRDAAENMTGKVKSAGDAAAEKASGAAAGAGSAVQGEGKGAVSSETDASTGASIGDGAALRGNTVSETKTMAENAAAGVEAGAGSALETTNEVEPGLPAAEVDPTSKLTEMGYTEIEPVEAETQASGETAFKATNAEGEEVNVVVDARTGAVVSEQPAGEGKM